MRRVVPHLEEVMTRMARVLLHGAVVGLLVVPSVAAQTLDQVCPGALEGTGALFGTVADTDADMVVPRASVIALWSLDGQEQRYEVEAGLDGTYAMCLPLLTSFSLHASFATVSGTPLEVTMTEIFTRRDLSLSLSSAGGGDERLWLCVNGGQSVINDQFSRLVRCDENWQPLERCPKVELGLISVHPVGAGSGMLREMIEQLVQEAKRIGANAVVNVQDSRGGLSFGGALHATSITGEGVRIEVDPSTCR